MSRIGTSWLGEEPDCCCRLGTVVLVGELPGKLEGSGFSPSAPGPFGEANAAMRRGPYHEAVVKALYLKPT